MTPERDSVAAGKRLLLIAVLILAGLALVLGLLFWIGADGGVTADADAAGEL